MKTTEKEFFYFLFTLGAVGTSFSSLVGGVFSSLILHFGYTGISEFSTIYLLNILLLFCSLYLIYYAGGKIKKMDE